MQILTDDRPSPAVRAAERYFLYVYRRISVYIVRRSAFIAAVESRDRVPGQLILLLHEWSWAQVSCAAVLWGPEKMWCIEMCTPLDRADKKLGLQNALRSAGKTLG